MATQAYQNRQAPVAFSITNAAAVDVLATAPGAPEYLEGMSCNGGAVLHLEVDASQALLSDLSLIAYRRSTRTAPWSQFFTDTVTAGAVYSQDIPGLSGWADVRVTLQCVLVETQTVRVSAKITPLP